MAAGAGLGVYETISCHVVNEVSDKVLRRIVVLQQRKIVAVSGVGDRGGHGR